jgi:DNA-binding LytR/AlgR family response regulator
VDKKQNFDKLKLEKQNEPESRFVNFSDENGDIKLSIKLDDLLYIEASENYVTIHYLDHTQPDRLLLRNSMKRMEEQLSGYPVVRCHRSYMVNINQIRLVRKDKSGLILHLNSLNKIILPISTSYKDYFKSMVQQF